MQHYGFLAAGGGERYSGPLNRLHPGDRIVVYQKGAGYLGYGIVNAPSVIASDFKTESGPLLEPKLAQPGERNHALVAVKAFLGQRQRPPRRYIAHTPCEGTSPTKRKARERVQ